MKRRPWHPPLHVLPLLLLQLSSFVWAKSDYLYKDLENVPVIDFYIDPNEDEPNEPDFIYEEKFPHHRVVNFYSPVCPHCIKFAPHYIEFARQNRYAAGVQVDFYAVSCVAHRDICKDQKIKGYPSIKIFAKGTSHSGVKIDYGKLSSMSLLKALGVSLVDDHTSSSSSSSSTKTIADNYKKKQPQPPPSPKFKVSLPSITAFTTPAKEKQQSATALSNDQTTNKIPAFLPRRPAEIFSDAYLSFHTSMKTAVFVEERLSMTKMKVLRKWIKTLHQVLPPWRIHTLLEALLGGGRQKFSEQTFLNVLDEHPPVVEEYSAACQLHESPYTCGLWTLFHIMTVGVVEFNAAAKHDAVRFNGLAMAKLLRDFVEHFLLCEQCTKHFLQEYDGCTYDRCTRLGAERNTPEDWKELPLWLLEFHNGVNIRLAYERLDTPLFTSQDQQAVMWPPVKDCPNCWLETGGSETAKLYNHTQMYNFMRMTYWPEDPISLATRQELNRLGVQPHNFDEIVVPLTSNNNRKSSTVTTPTKGGNTHDNHLATSSSQQQVIDETATTMTGATIPDVYTTVAKDVRYAMLGVVLCVFALSKRRIRRSSRSKV